MHDTAELEHYILDAMNKWEVPGLAISLVKDGKVVLAKGYGTREIGKKLPVDAHTLFAITGTTASFTASALALLVSEGKLNWDDRLVDLLPNFKTGDDLVTNNATVIDALANRTGLPMELLSLFPHTDLNRTDVLGRMEYLQSAHGFRSCWGLNLHMNVAAGELIPALTGISWEHFICDRLFKPVGMMDSLTGPNCLPDNINVATPHDRDGSDVKPISHARTSHIGPAASIYSSASDMAKWLIFQLNNGVAGGEVIIPEEEIGKYAPQLYSCKF